MNKERVVFYLRENIKVQKQILYYKRRRTLARIRRWPAAGFSKMHGFATIFFLLWLVPSVLIVYGYQDYDPYNTVRKEEQIYHGRRVRPVADGVLENGGDRAEKALGELRERIEDAEVIEPHGRNRRESLLGLDVPYKAPPPAGEQQQNRDGGSIGGARFRENSMAKEQRGKQPKLFCN
uniref:Uncharacterized protein n=1 Tax=Globodera rostochiensis TaxID=31243 RepID=A0A914IDN5_GLORO